MKKIFILLAITTAMWSCEDATDIVQPSEFNFEAAFRTVADVKNATFVLYNSANSASGLEFTAQFTDETSLGASGNQGSDTHRLQINVSNAFAGQLWSRNYSVVRNANILFTGAALVTPADAAEQALYDESLAEAYALRAYAYSQLLAYFAVDLSDPSSLAVPIFDDIPSANFAPTRSTVQEVVDKINDDLMQADALFASAGTAYSVEFTSPVFVNALRARVAAYVGDYGPASTFANAVLANFTLPTTASSTDYRQVWEDVAGVAQTQEVIFKFNNTLATSGVGNRRLGQVFNTNASTPSGAPLYEMSRVLFDQLTATETNFGDIRRRLYIDPAVFTGGWIVGDYPNDPNPQINDRLVVDKYPGDPSLPGLVGGYTNDQKVFRTVEMHFILAEAAAAAGNLNGAGGVGAQLKLIRDARYTTPQPATNFTSPQEAWNAIVTERKLELAFEGHRYIDIKRLGALANQGYDRNDTDCSLYPSSECDISFNDFRARALPIPQSELQGNPGITQNPMY
ncbi:MAG: RagB/SusD family nutrient uptake outer membrane protein [Nonlabens sp.]|nr:RagB/SusD family nutrient uptake outer membrane protein [Nonlabens sp.]